MTALLLLTVNPWKPFALADGLFITCYWFIPAIICTFICTFKLDPFMKAGICTAIAAVIFYGSNFVIENILGDTTGNYYKVDFSNWEQCINGNVNLLVFVGLLLIGVTFVAVGYFRNRRMK